MEAAVPSKGSLVNNRFVRVIVISTMLLQVGIWVRNFSILLFVTEQTHNNPFAVSLISVAEFSPIFLFSFIGGAFADRWLPKRTMVWCDLLSAISVFAVLLAIVFGTWKAVFLVTFISAILSQFSQPSAMKLFKVHVSEEHLQTGLAMFQTLMAIFMIIGPLLGTIVYHNFGINVSIGVMGVAFLLSAVVLTFLPADNQTSKEKPVTSFWLELKGGFFYVLNRKVLTILGGVFIVAGLAVGAIQPLGIFIIMERLGLPKENLQWLLSVNGAAMLIGGAAVMGVAKRTTPQKLLALGLLMNAVAIAGIGISVSWPVTLALQFMNGFFMPFIHIGINTLILQLTEEDFVGRVNGVLNPMFMGALVVTMSMAGWLKENFSLMLVYLIAAGLFVIGVFLTVLIFNTSSANKPEALAEGE